MSIEIEQGLIEELANGVVSSTIKAKADAFVGILAEDKAIADARKEAADAAGDAVDADTKLASVKALVLSIYADREDGIEVDRMAKMTAVLFAIAAERAGVPEGTAKNYGSLIRNLPVKLEKASVTPDQIAEAKQSELQFFAASDEAQLRTVVTKMVKDAIAVPKNASQADIERATKRARAIQKAVSEVLTAEVGGVKVKEPQVKQAANG